MDVKPFFYKAQQFPAAHQGSFFNAALTICRKSGDPSFSVDVIKNLLAHGTSSLDAISYDKALYCCANQLHENKELLDIGLELIELATKNWYVDSLFDSYS